MIMTRTYPFLVSTILLLLTSANIQSRGLMIGTINFPKNLPTIPHVRIYYEGKIVNGTPDNQKKSISFSIPKLDQEFKFTLLITESIEFAISEVKIKDTQQNTISFMKIPEEHTYKLYDLLLLPKFNTENSKKPTLEYQWKVCSQLRCMPNRMVPDNALVLLLDPAWIESVQGTTEYEFPTITIDQARITENGSTEQFYKKTDEIILAAIDSDTMHAMSDKPAIKQAHSRVTIAAPAA